MEINVLRIPTDALVTSLLRCGLSVYGSGAYEQAPPKMDTYVVNATAGRILGAGHSARLPVLLATAGAQSMRNLYQQHCAEMLDSGMRATASSIQTRLRK